MTTRDTANIVLVHLGQRSLPAHLMEMIAGTISVAPQSTITLIADSAHQHTIEHASVARGFADRVAFVSTESITPSQTTQEFRTITPLDRSFRDGFWLYASERFLVLADFLESRRVSNCLHLENDVQLYFDPTDKLAVLQNFASFAVPLDRNRAIPGVVWIRTPEVARTLAMHISIAGGIDDMMSVGKFCSERPDLSSAFPTMPEAYLLDHGLDINRYGNGLAAFGGIFDAAAIGQFLGGIHWLNNPEDTRFFLNESSDLNMTDFDFSWTVKDRQRYPRVSYKSKNTSILAIHVHSKNIGGFSPKNTGAPESASEVLTEKRIQYLCELAIGTSELTSPLKDDSLSNMQILDAPERVTGRFFKKHREVIPPSEDFIDTCRSARTIFVYVEMLDYFQSYIAPRLCSDFVLITNNANQPLTQHQLSLLNHPNLKALFLQSTELQHRKIQHLPIGITCDWIAEKNVLTLLKQSKEIVKNKSLYSNINTTNNRSASEALVQAQQLTSHHNFSGSNFEQHIRNLSEHKFCLCLTGKGQNSHLFWEAQYMDCIPIIIKSDWIGAYSNLPLLVLDSWKDLSAIDLAQEYVRVTTTAFDRSTLRMTYYRKLISELTSR